jgi:hypothetical protein
MGQVLFLTFVLLLNPLWPGHDETSSSCQRRNWNDQSSLVTFRLSTYGVAVFVACLCAITTIVAFSPKKKKRTQITPAHLPHHGLSSGSPLTHMCTRMHIHVM